MSKSAFITDADRYIIKGLVDTKAVVRTMKESSASAYNMVEYAATTALEASQKCDNASWTAAKDAAQRAAAHARDVAQQATKAAIDASTLACIISAHQQKKA
jgi:hypothetical protein